MAAPNLTREQADQRARLVTVDGYRIVLDLTDGDGGPGEGTFRSRTTVEFGAVAGADTFIDIVAEKVHSATLNGEAIDVSGYDESRGIELAGLADRNVVVVDADCRYSRTGEGLHRFVDPKDSEVYLYTQFETAEIPMAVAAASSPMPGPKCPPNWPGPRPSPGPRRAPAGRRPVHRRRRRPDPGDRAVGDQTAERVGDQSSPSSWAAAAIAPAISTPAPSAAAPPAQKRFLRFIVRSFCP